MNKKFTRQEVEHLIEINRKQALEDVRKLIDETEPKNNHEWNNFNILIQERNDKHTEERMLIRTNINPKIRQRDNYKCLFCNKDIREISLSSTIHHKKPERYNGNHKEDNLITICMYCHQLLEEMIGIVERESIKHTFYYLKQQINKLENEK